MWPAPSCRADCTTRPPRTTFEHLLGIQRLKPAEDVVARFADMREEWTVRGNFTSCLSSTASQLRKSPLWATAPKSSREASGAVNGDRFGVAE
jgi:hypothetical protein